MMFIDDDGIEKEVNEENIRRKILRTLLAGAGGGGGGGGGGAMEEGDQNEDNEEDQDLQTVSQCFQKLSKDAQDFYLCRSIPERFNNPKPLDFYREWVSYNRPVIFRNAASHWPAIEKWQDNNYLMEKLGDKEVSVTITPNGYADAIVDDKFVMPLEENIKFSDFVDKIESRNRLKESLVYYIQKQNSNFTDEFNELMEDVEEIGWASEAFGKEPDAINFWMGEEKAVTSSHKDPYENIYCVVRGHKDITLYPPTDLPWLPYKDCYPAIYKRSPHDENKIIIEELNDVDMVPWIDIDPLNPDYDKYPQYRNANPVQCRLNAGDLLYLPSLWFHHLKQSQGCIAVNFWYDMEYNSNFNYFNLLSNLVKINKSS